MEMLALVSSLLATRAGNVRGQIAAAIIKNNADAEKFAVATLLGQPSQANLGPGIGGALDKLA